MIEGDVAIVDGYFAGIGDFEGKKVIDAKGCLISPSFIDGHVHIESSMVTPQEFAKVLLLHGVTTVIAALMKLLMFQVLTVYNLCLIPVKVYQSTSYLCFLPVYLLLSLSILEPY